MIHLEHLSKVTGGEFVQFFEDSVTRYLVTDSRKVNVLNESVFLAIRGVRHDGHAYVRELFDRGMRNFIVESPVELPGEANVFQVPNTLKALQDIAAHHRSGFDIPVVGITGSNGKTIIKEWLYKLLSLSKNVVKSPRSYNSQLGVPLSVWQIHDDHDIGVFEAGISKMGEMERLEKIIRPTLGIFSNIGSAHDEGFVSRQQKVNEKALLFKNCERVIYCKDHELIDHVLKSKGFTWGFDPKSDIQITRWEEDHPVELNYLGEVFHFDLPFHDKPSFENIMHCIAGALYLGIAPHIIQTGLSKLSGVKMRLELKKGMNNCYLVDDSYNNDLAGLQTALDFLEHQTKNEKKTVILSDILEAGGDPSRLYAQVAEMLRASNVQRFVGVGPALRKFISKFPSGAHFYSTTEELTGQLGNLDLKDETILVKGARNFHFEKLVKQLEEKIHGTVLEINLDGLTQNLNFYRAQLNEGTKLMVMVKAFAYGSGSFEVANLLQYHHVDYLGVAYADEGVALRQQGIRLPIMVMNPSPDSFEKLVSYRLEPEVYSVSLLERLLDFVGNDPMGIHIKLDTGMHRLGFDQSTMGFLIQHLKDHPHL
ncbi:MAG: UDP-N-acetylmuramoyl-tripeptide--D-alanyl-D-alanine ligase, partial [Cytophagales bacterium]|nr:UDP-N-acetylmuramoyl-tripeptide--D-alanyl-D-alanine ligase [Cytophagales bacterium]